jgi:iron transport multicopper oxidase
VYNSTLINGKGRYPGGPATDLAVVNVIQGTRSVLHLILNREELNMRHPESYRLRLVSISCDPAYNFSIDGHQMSVIEVDGTNVQPLQVDSLEIFAGMEI